jgi:hypothetical protein
VVQAHGHKRVWHDVTNADQLRVRMTWRDGREAEFFQSDIAGATPEVLRRDGRRSSGATAW